MNKLKANALCWRNKQRILKKYSVDFFSETSERFFKYSLLWILNHVIEYLSSMERMCFFFSMVYFSPQWSNYWPSWLLQSVTRIREKEVTRVAMKMFTLMLYNYWQRVGICREKQLLKCPLLLHSVLRCTAGFFTY